MGGHQGRQYEGHRREAPFVVVTIRVHQESRRTERKTREDGTLLVRNPEEKMTSMLRIITRKEGQDLLEYGLLASLIAIFAIGAVKLLADQITSVFWGAIATKF